MQYEILKEKAIELKDNDKQTYIDGFKVLDNRKFIESHIETIDSHRGNLNFSAFYYRLLSVVNQLLVSDSI